MRWHSTDDPQALGTLGRATLRSPMWRELAVAVRVYAETWREVTDKRAELER